MNPPSRKRGTAHRRSSAGLTKVESLIVVGILGLLAVLLAPAYRKVRALAQDNTVRNNLRQLANAENSYFLERGVSSVTSETLLEKTPTRDAISIIPVAGEIYPAILIKGAPVTASGIAGERTVTFNY